MQFKTRTNYKLKCNCGVELGEQQGSWWVYEIPLRCSTCRMINTNRLLKIIGVKVGEKSN
jgi:hypothetical protein